MTKERKNRFARNAKISEQTYLMLVRSFANDLTAVQISPLLGINRNTTNRYINILRSRVILYSEIESAARISAPKIRLHETRESNRPPLIGIVKVENKIACEQLPSLAVETFVKNFKMYKKTGAEIPQVSNKYDMIIDALRWKRFRFNERASGNKRRMDVVENFWALLKSRLLKFRGVKKNKLYAYVKECEFRFNHRNENLEKKILAIVDDGEIA